jgi:hypothetical protein
MDNTNFKTTQPSLVAASFREKVGISAVGKVEVWSGKAHNIVTDTDGNVISYEFERRKQVVKKNNAIARVGFFQLLQNGFTSPSVIAIGNGDNGSVNGTGGAVNPANFPNENNTQLNHELNNGRFRTFNRENRLDTTTGVATWNAFIPFNAYSGLITEWGLFSSISSQNSFSSAILQKNSGALVARLPEVYTKPETDDLDVTWTITTILNP